MENGLHYLQLCSFYKDFLGIGLRIHKVKRKRVTYLSCSGTPGCWGVRSRWSLRLSSARCLSEGRTPSHCPNPLTCSHITTHVLASSNFSDLQINQICFNENSVFFLSNICQWITDLICTGWAQTGTIENHPQRVSMFRLVSGKSLPPVSAVLYYWIPLRVLNIA